MPAIRPSTAEDLHQIFELYESAIAYQKQVGNNHWQGFSEELVRREIVEGRHFMILHETRPIGTFCVTFDDRVIWGPLAAEPSIFLHRIATAEVARGMHVLESIIGWAKQHAETHGLAFIRLDTGAGNDRLIGYYIRSGFTFVGETVIDYTPDLPAHYKDARFALLEMRIVAA